MRPQREGEGERERRERGCVGLLFVSLQAQEVSDQFASLVGHQNSRQKIRYVKKIRDENTALKMVRWYTTYHLRLTHTSLFHTTGAEPAAHGALKAEEAAETDSDGGQGGTCTTKHN